MPQHRFASIHVVGTNGKSSVAEMAGALLEAHGMRTGVYLSPHTERWSERVRIGGAEIDPGEFAAAAERVAQSTDVVNRTLADGESVTQFEAVTATAFVALASARVELGVIEAGLGGRLDATNVLPSQATALTSVGLEHTEWLGETEEAIATEKLAVLRDHSTLVLGQVGDGVRALAERTAAERNARLVVAGDPDPELRLSVPGAYQRRNFAVAAAAVQAILGRLDPDLARGVAEGLALPGRDATPEGRPTVDPRCRPQSGWRRRTGRGAARGGRRGAGRRLSRDAGREGRGRCHRGARATARGRGLHGAPGRAAGAGWAPGRPGAGGRAIGGAGRAAGLTATEAVPEPTAAVGRARALARELHGIVLLTGSHYLLPYA